MHNEIETDPNYEAITPEHSAPFEAVTVSSNGHVMHLEVINHIPDLRSLTAIIKSGGIDYPGLRDGDCKIFAPYGYIHVLREGGTPVTSPKVKVWRTVTLLKCAKPCGHVLTDDEYHWRDESETERIATCPKCGGQDFYTLNKNGQAIHGFGDNTEVNPEEIEPSPRMGLKMKRRILAAKRRCLAASSSSAS